MAIVKYELKKDFGKICSKNGFDVFLRLIEWNGNPAKYDLRGWSSDKAGHGVVFSKEELKTLASLIDKVLENDTNVEVEEEVKPEPKKRGRKPKVVEEVKEEKVEPKKEKKSDNVVQFPGEKPNIIALPKSNGKATVLECREKLRKAREIYKDSDSAYVINKLLELCDSSQDFRNNVMREEKSYAGGFEYMVEQVRKGYCMTVGQGVQYLDDELAYALFVDYFNMDEDAMKAEKERIAAEEKAKREAAKKNEPKKTTRGRKKKEA